jgi:uncharacterized protein (TIGR03435 family)
MRFSNALYLLGMLLVLSLKLTSQQYTDRSQPNSQLHTESRSEGITEFSVASIKPSNPADPRWKMSYNPTGFVCVGVTLKMLIQEAYDISEASRIINVPKGLDSQKFDIVAKVDEADIDEFHNMALDRRRVLLQNLLQQRFHLKAHLESRISPVYKQVINRPGEIHLKATSIDDKSPTRISRSRSGQLTAQGESMGQLAAFLSNRLDRPVIDRTGLTGRYDISLDWRPEEKELAFIPPSGVMHQQAESEYPSIFLAIKEQLGLRLQPAQYPVTILVTDHVEAPTIN